MNTMEKPALSRPVLWLMAVSSGLVVANNYYNQPLLSLIAAEFKVSSAEVSTIAMLTQVGYALGLLVIVPLGDLLRRKRLIVIDFALILLALLGMATGRSLQLLYVFSVLIGFSSVVPQLFVPMAATLAHPDKRTQAIGLVMSGLLMGILGSRILSGWVGSVLGWRAMYYIAAGIISVLWLLIIWQLPEVHPSYKGTYRELMKSVIHYARTEPLLQAAALRGALLFASFSAFWTSLVFHLQQEPFHADSAVAGAFGIVGMAGALMAALVGKIAGKVTHFSFVTWLLFIFIGSWALFHVTGNTWIGLIAGVLILDVAMQAIHIMNQSSIFSLHPQANNRLNTVYMTAYFVGGATGTFLAGLAWQHWQWRGVLGVGTGFGVLALLVHMAYKKYHTAKTQ